MGHWGCLADKGKEWLLTMSAINDLKFDRCVVPDVGRVHAALLMAKSRLAPIKHLSVQRLELCVIIVAVKWDIIIRA